MDRLGYNVVTVANLMACHT